MSNTEELIQQIKNTSLFSQVQDIILNFTIDIKSHMWTREILTYNLNFIIDKFLNSEFDKIDDFFKKYLTDNFGNVDRKKQKYCFNLILSLNHFASKFNYLRFYQKIFSHQIDYAYYNFFWEIKAEMLPHKNTDNIFYLNMDSIFLCQSKWQHLLQKCLFYDLKQIKEFESNISKKIMKKKRKQQIKYISDFIRNGEYNATFFIEEVLNRFAVMYKDAKSKQLTTNPSSLDVFEGEDINYEEIVRNTNLGVNNVQKDPEIRITQLQGYHAKLMERERFLAEIKNYVTLRNKYKTSTAKLLSYIQEIDPIISETKQKIQKQREAFLTSRRAHAKGDKSEAFSSQTTAPMTNFLENGSTLFSTNGSTIRRKLLFLSTDSYGRTENRSMDYYPIVRALISRLKKVIFTPGFSLAKKEDQFSIENAKEDLNKIFKEYNNLDYSQIAILDTFFNNAERSTIGRNSIEVNNVFENASKKLMSVFDKGLQINELDEFTSDDGIKKDFDTFKQIASIKDEEYKSLEKQDKIREKILSVKAKNTILSYQNPKIVNDRNQPKNFDKSQFEFNNDDIKPLKIDFTKNNIFIKKNGSPQNRKITESVTFYEIEKEKSFVHKLENDGRSSHAKMSAKDEVHDKDESFVELKESLISEGVKKNSKRSEYSINNNQHFEQNDHFIKKKSTQKIPIDEFNEREKSINGKDSDFVNKSRFESKNFKKSPDKMNQESVIVEKNSIHAKISPDKEKKLSINNQRESIKSQTTNLQNDQSNNDNIIKNNNREKSLSKNNDLETNILEEETPRSPLTKPDKVSKLDDKSIYEQLVKESQNIPHRASSRLDSMMFENIPFGPNLGKKTGLVQENNHGIQELDDEGVEERIDSIKRESNLKQIPAFSSFDDQIDKEQTKSKSVNKQTQLHQFGTLSENDPIKKPSEINKSPSKISDSDFPKISLKKDSITNESLNLAKLSQNNNIVQTSSKKSLNEKNEKKSSVKNHQPGSIFEEEVESRLSEIPKSVVNDNQLYGSGKQEKETNLTPFEQQLKNSDISPKKSIFEKTLDDDHVNSHLRDLSSENDKLKKQPTIKDKIKDKKFLNSPKGKYIAEEIGFSGNAEKKNIKNFFAGFLGKKKDQ